MKAMGKPLKMWPKLYTVMAPIRKLLEPLALFKWGEEQCEAWEHARKYILGEFSLDSDDESDRDNNDDQPDEETTLTGADLQNLGMSGTKPRKFMTPGAMSQGTTEPKPGANRDIGDDTKKCKPPPMHPFYSVYLTQGASINTPTYGLSEDTMKAFKIAPPITPRIFIKNLAYGVSEAKLVEVFSLSGKIVEVTLYRHDNGESKGRATVEYAHPLEAVQAIVMFKNAKLLSRKIIIEQDRIGPQPTMTRKLPDGLLNVEEGIGMGGADSKCVT